MKIRVIDSHLNEEYLEKYGNGKIFIETGTYLGDTVHLALQSGYEKIHSIELNSDLFYNAVTAFSENPNVRIWFGDSVDCLSEILEQINEPATFWLDAHASGPLPGGKSGGSPVLDELRIIANHPIKEHTIFIDDRRLFGGAEWSFVTEDSAIQLIKEINPSYNIYHLDGHTPEDVLCATIR